MARGELIGRNTGIGYESTVSFSGANSLCYWGDTTYFYISAQCFEMLFKGNYALVCPGYKVWLQKWNGSAWEEVQYMYVKNNRKRFGVNAKTVSSSDAESHLHYGSGYIYRFAMQPWEGSYREYLGAEFTLHRFAGEATEAAYNNYLSTMKGHRIGRVNANPNQYYMLTKDDLTPSQVPIYNTTVYRGAPILDAIPKSEIIAID